jgi:hypothetical protein
MKAPFVSGLVIVNEHGAPQPWLGDLSVETAKKQIGDTILMMKNEANRLTALVEYGEISVPEYENMMWEHLGISPRCLKEGVSYVIKPEPPNEKVQR